MRNSHGVTLTELAVVAAIAAVVLLGLMGFYFNSQATWIEGSTRAVAQRDATLLIEDIRGSVHEARSIIVEAGPDAFHDTVNLLNASGVVYKTYWWNSASKQVHEGAVINEGGPVVETRVEQFKFLYDVADSTVLHLTNLTVRTANNDTLSFISSFALHNR